MAEPKKKPVPSQMFAIPEGWVAKGYTFGVQWPKDRGAAKVRSHFGARRFRLQLGSEPGEVRAGRPQGRPRSMSRWAGTCTPSASSGTQRNWSLPPWWAENSNEADATGITDLCVALKNWREHKDETR